MAPRATVVLGRSISPSGGGLVASSAMWGKCVFLMTTGWTLALRMIATESIDERLAKEDTVYWT
jgi:hypothetical protein